MRKFGIVVLSIILFTTVAIAQKRTLDKVVAIVGGSIILQSDIDLPYYTSYIAQGGQPNPAIKCQILQNAIAQKLLVQQAILDSIDVKDVTPEDIDAEIDLRMRRMTQQAGSQEKLEAFLNKSVYQYKEEIRPDVKDILVAQKMRQKITEKQNTTPLDVKKYFENLPKDSIPTFGKEVQVGEIVFDAKLNKDEKQYARNKAEDLLKRVKGGEDFAALAVLYSQDPGSSSQGGDYGFIDRNTPFATEFMAWAFKLKANEISPVFETDFGYHVLQVLERRGESVHVRHILIIPDLTPSSLTRAKSKADTIYNLLIKNKRTDNFSTVASYYSDDKETKVNGGMLLTQNDVDVRTTFIPTDKLDPQIALVVDTMKVGKFSTPQLFTDANGKKSYRIYYLKSVVDAHKASLAQDFPRLKTLATTEKTSRVVSQWFEKKRKETYIKIDPEYESCPALKGWATTSKTPVNP